MQYDMEQAPRGNALAVVIVSALLAGAIIAGLIFALVLSLVPTGPRVVLPMVRAGFEPAALGFDPAAYLIGLLIGIAAGAMLFYRRPPL